jgi:hypothetical protein
MNVSHENTVRALKEMPLIAERQWLCALGIHTWTVWTEPEVNKRSGFQVCEQYRTCVCCGEFKRKVLFSC